jgi:hypothetical protein
MADFVALKAGSLDDPAQFKPMIAGVHEQRTAVGPVHDDLPKFDQQPG